MTKKYKEQLDTLIRNRVFRHLFERSKVLQRMFEVLQYADFNKSFYEVLKTKPVMQRKAFVEVLQDEIKDSSELIDYV